MAKIINSLKYKLAILLGQAKVKKNGSTRIFDYKKYLPIQKSEPKRALVSYLVDPIIDELSGVPTVLFSNNGAGRSIPKVLNELGYIVDIINWDDTQPIDGEYDLIICHGGKNFDALKQLKTSDNKLVYYSTGSYWKYHNEQEQVRLSYFRKRHNIPYKLDREIKNTEELANTQADAIIALGNKDTAKTYTKFKKVYHIEGASMPINSPRILVTTTNPQKGFLFMAGPGNLHKGLDVLLDVWSTLPEDHHLHIVTFLDKEFATIYHEQLYKTSNIHTYGYIQQRSKEFYNIIDQCQYSILLSCSEGSPGSVIESMCQGLLPIVSKQCHVSTHSYGKVIPVVTVEHVAKTMQELSKVNSADIHKEQQSVAQWANAFFTVDKYEHTLRTIIQEVIQ